MRLTLAVDFGSTCTKVVAIDRDGESPVGAAQLPSTVGASVVDMLLPD